MGQAGAGPVRRSLNPVRCIGRQFPTLQVGLGFCRVEQVSNLPSILVAHLSTRLLKTGSH